MAPNDEVGYGLNEKFNPNRKLRRFKAGAKTDTDGRKFTHKGAKHSKDEYTSALTDHKKWRRDARKAAQRALRSGDEQS